MTSTFVWDQGQDLHLRFIDIFCWYIFKNPPCKQRGCENTENTSIRWWISQFFFFPRTVIIFGQDVFFSLLSRVAALQSKWQTGIQLAGPWFTLISRQFVKSQFPNAGFLQITSVWVSLRCQQHFSFVCFFFTYWIRRKFNTWCLDQKCEMYL